MSEFAESRGVSMTTTRRFPAYLSGRDLAKAGLGGAHMFRNPCDLFHPEALRATRQSVPDRLQRQEQQQRHVWKRNETEAFVIGLRFVVLGIHK